MDAILKFLSSNKDALLVVIACITVTLGLFTLLFGSGFLVAFFKSIAAYLQQRLRPRIPPLDTFPFEVIKPNSDVLKAVFGGAKDNPLADRNIRYLQRVADRDMQQELEAQLEESRWVMILGETGLGKTREAAELAQKYNRKGWTVLRLKHSELLDEPFQFPMEKVGSERKLLFFLDDLNKLMYKRGELLKDDPRQFRDLPPQERLRLTLEYYERFCRPEEIRIIATARNETVPQYNEPISELDKLGFDRHPRLWQKFTRYLLLKPDDAAIIQLIQATVEQADITANPDEYARLARRNDRTFRNIQLNLQTAKDEGRALTLDTFRESLRESWEAKYRKATRKYPIAAVIYDAVELLRAVNVELHDFTVIATTQMLAGGNFLQQFQRWQPIRRALHYLIHDGNSILEPRDGQIEAKGTSVAVAEKIPRLSRLLLKLSDRYSPQMLFSLFDFALAANDLECYQESLASLNKLLKFIPDFDSVWLLRGHSLSQWGSLLKDSGQDQQASTKFLDAIASYEAIAIKPDDHAAWYNWGFALCNLERYEEAIVTFDEAIAVKPDDHAAWYNRGFALGKLKRYKEAIDSYDKAIAIKPNDHAAWYSRGFGLINLERYEEAIDSYDKVVTIKPDYPEVWNARGIALGNLERYEEALTSFDRALEFQLEYPGFYNKACCYALLGQVDLALENLQRAMKLAPDQCHEEAQSDAAFDNVRNDVRFQALMAASL